MVKQQKTGLNFALIGAAGYIAPRHMKAIKDTNNNLIAALDPKDSVGIIDSFFPNADFFIEFERFDRHIDKLRREGKNAVDYVSICSPNYLHDAHIRFALRNNADAICEKPLVLNPWNVEALTEFENENQKRVHTILQLRLHPAIIALKEKIANDKTGKIYDIDLTYITSRGHWYYISWKGDETKSGGVATNIGIHFFDMLIWIFGSPKNIKNYISQKDVASGFIELERANVRWFLSINQKYVPQEIASKGQRTYRSIAVDGEEIEFSEGFADLHTESYKNILQGKGFTLSDSISAIDCAYQIRNAKTSPFQDDYHPFCKGFKS